MKFAYQVAMPEVKPDPMVTAYQGDLRDAFRLLRDNGYDAAELMLCKTDSETVRLLRSLCKEFGLEVCMLATGELYGQERLALSHSDPAVRERCVGRFRDFIDVAREFGAQVNIGRARGMYLPGVPRAETERLALEGLKIVADYAASRQVTLILEPVNFLQCDFIHSAADGRAWVDRIASPYFKIMLDTFHMNIQDRNIREQILASKGYFSYVHLSDNNRLHPGNCGLDFKDILAALAETGYDGVVSVEVLQLPDSPTAIRESARHILPLLGR